MDYRRYLIELGTGVDMHGEDETKAAKKAVRDAISHCSMIGLGQLFKTKSFGEMQAALMVDVTISTPNPEKVNGEEVLKELPEGNRRIRIVKGGLRFPTEGTPEEARTHGITMVNAAIVVLIDVDKVERR
ncbi:hypothetical protein FJY84_00720 [Candidatus Bathyarchaeota archaeon]|nr:hypothetical protein [Candidatus Bathyarchaeota archaeon]